MQLSKRVTAKFTMASTPYPQSKSDAIRFEGRVEAKALVLQIAQQAKKQICIFGKDIDTVLFNQAELIHIISDLARQGHNTKIKILVHDTATNVQFDHRLIPLAQHLTSSIFIHNTAKQHRQAQNTQILVDDFAYLNCPHTTVYSGYACLYDRLELRKLQKIFNEQWEQSSPDINIRRLNL